MITVITAWYNEEFLAPLFLNHYSFADRIIIMLDESTNDGTIDEIKKFMARDSFISFRKLKMPDGMDDQLKIKQMNAAYKGVESGWVIFADADEFIYMPLTEAYFENEKTNVICVDYYQMYQHKSEFLLNSVDPVFEQRRHGKKEFIAGTTATWMKPCIGRAGIGLVWGPGHHTVNYKNIHLVEYLRGAHWHMADANLAITRRINGRKKRMSQENIRLQSSVHNFTITEQEIIDFCESRMDSELVF